MRRKVFDRGGVGRWGGGVLPIAFLFLAAKPQNRLAAQEPLNAGALFLVFPVGAQAVGMGQTATAAEGRGEAAFWNPAGLATLSDDEFALHSATLVAGRSHVLGAYFPSRGIGVIGGAAYLVVECLCDPAAALGATDAPHRPPPPRRAAPHAAGRLASADLRADHQSLAV